MNIKKQLLPIKICVSGARHSNLCGGQNSLKKAKELGKIIAEHKCILNTPAASGFPLWAAMGTKENNGVSIGFSPASNEREHIEVYRLPTGYMDMIIYSGFGYAGADLLLSRSSDAVIFGCGHIETLHEFAIAFQENKPIGILKGDWDTDEILKIILKDNVEKSHDNIIFDDDPNRLVEQVIKLAKKDRIKSFHI